ncbi:YeiH family protein [Erwinia pyrifoliae]|uniref:YeiH family protein n=1 Tax=Erwinia pyrifoliae TaxID=79967 RepID=UPI0001960B0E|nr:YeiH family putative sulfate export transporter [Erwinia pyrifoliae]AUX73140.1 YeiH family putative sulfate export transporter [Erwinia pyrifoliae]MCA8876577.1 YeiH family putative sulfate export transporter [Erwinia pyrifoliae]MCT2386691.1 YeiH family putative sulfate export transporter [Erwinia pyrifoliae]MCU8587711.1 YeiH family putative sulfate export transporter [Erwinia pyrifoliae]UWS31508.1 YeiH family putative sulfate export transporter [Erwinia pyrifoliae]
MSVLTTNPPAQNPARHIPGLLLAVTIAVLATSLGHLPHVAALGVGSLTLAIIGGIIVGNTFYSRLASHCDSGTQLAKQQLLRAGIVLYGFRLTLQQLTDVGISGVIIDVLTLGSTFLLACWLGQRLLGLDRDTSWLIGAGSSICGAAAILATEPLIKADTAKVAVAIATVVIFGTLAIFIYPLMWPLVSHLLPLVSASEYGVYIGSTMHEVAQVVAAGHAVGAETENSAVIAKLLRVMLLAPFLLLLAARVQRSDGPGHSGPIAFPWFALLFIAVTLFNSLHLLPAHWIAYINQLDNLLLATAMAALGLTTRIAALKRAGFKPLLLGLVLFIWLMGGGGAINLLVRHLMA